MCICVSAVWFVCAVCVMAFFRIKYIMSVNTYDSFVLFENKSEVGRWGRGATLLLKIVMIFTVLYTV